jgi:UDP-2-acetamido-2-deoxy-ribo-hexuluronate aminotransferase
MLEKEIVLDRKLNFTGLSEQAAMLREQVAHNIARVLDHGQFIMGPEVRKLEEELQNFSGAKHAITVANGTDALQICLLAFGIGHGDAVLVPSFTYTATAEVILVLGAIPIFVEVEPDSFNLDVADLQKKTAAARDNGLVPKAIIAVDLFGMPANWVALNIFAEKEGLALIADAAQSFGAVTASGAKVGTLAPVTTTSFFPAKPLGCYGDGGAIFTDNDDLAEIMKSIRVHGQGREKYETVRVGVNSRLDTVQAAVLLAKLSIFEKEISSRNAMADAYELALNGLVKTPKKPNGVTSAWAQYTIRVENRDDMQRALAADGVPTAVYYPKPMHMQKAYMAYARHPLPVSEQLSAEVLSLPMNPYWITAEVERVQSAIAQFISSQ